MRTTLRTLFVASALTIGLALTMTGCTLFNAAVNPIFGESASGDTRAWAEKVFIGFNKGWIPALALYRSQAQCGPGVRAPCWEPVIYKKLHSVTDAATACQVAATAPGVDVISLSDCIGKVTDAKLEFTQSGISPVGATP